MKNVASRHFFYLTKVILDTVYIAVYTVYMAVTQTNLFLFKEWKQGWSIYANVGL